MPFSFIFNEEILLAYYWFKGVNFTLLQGGLAVFGLEKIEKLLDFEIYMSQMLVMVK